MDKFTFYGQLPESDKDDLIALASDGIGVVLTEANGEAKLTITPGMSVPDATAQADQFETEWTAAQTP